MQNKSDARKEMARAKDSPSELKKDLKSRSKQVQGQGQQQPENMQVMSQSMQSAVSKVESFWDDLSTLETEVQDISEVCERQKLNHSELLCQREQLSFRQDREMKSQEAVLARYMNVFQLISALKEGFNGASYYLQQTVDVHTAAAMNLSEYKERLENMQTFLDTVNNVTIPSFLEYLKKQTLEGQETFCLLETQFDREIINNLKQSDSEGKRAEDYLSSQKTLSSDLQSQILLENEVSEQSTKDEAALLKDREQLKQTMKHQVKTLTQTHSCTEHDVQVANEEKGRLTLKTQNEQVELLQKKEREGILKSDLEPMKANAEYLSGTLLKKQTGSHDLTGLLDAETKRSDTLKTELKEIQLQLNELERNISCRTSELSEEVLKLSASAAEKELSSGEELKNLKTLEENILNEEGTIQQSLILMESQIQQLRDAYNEVCQSNTTLENNLGEQKEEIIKLNEEEKNLNGRSETIVCAIKALEQSLIQSRTIQDQGINDLENQLVCSEQEKCLASAELDSLTLTEQELNNKFEEIKRVSAYSDAEMTEHFENIITELNEQTEAAELKFQSINTKYIEEADEMNQKLKYVVEAVEKKRIEVNNYKEAILKSQSELDQLKISLQTSLKLKEIQDKSIKDLIFVTSGHSQKEQLQNMEGQSLALKLEDMKRKVEEVDLVISSLKSKLDQVQAETEKNAADHKNEKQVFFRDLVKFQTIAQGRAEDEKSLLKQKSALLEKCDTGRQHLLEVNSALQLKQQEAKQAQEELEKSEKDLQDAQEKNSLAEKALKNAEKDALSAKKKVDHLRSKISAHKASKKDKENRVNVVPKPQVGTPSKETTPKNVVARSDGKDITPRSILKSTLKSTTTPKKTVTFGVAISCSQSSSSSIVMPEVSGQGASHQVEAGIFKVPSQDGTHSRNTTPQFSSQRDGSENIPRASNSFSKSPQAPPNNCLDDSFDDASSSGSSIVMGPEIRDRLTRNPAAVHEIIAEHRAASAEKKRLKQLEMRNNSNLEQNNQTLYIPPQNVAHSQFSSERVVSENISGASNTFFKSPQKRKAYDYDDDFDDGASSSSSIVMGPEIRDRLTQNPSAVHEIIAEHRAASAEKRRLKQLEINTQAYNIPHQNVTPSRNTTPQFVPDNTKENTPRSILKSSRLPTPQKKAVTFAPDLDDNASSTSSALADFDLSAMTPAPQAAVKRMKLSPWGETTNNEISSSTPEK